MKVGAFSQLRLVFQVIHLEQTELNIMLWQVFNQKLIKKIKKIKINKQINKRTNKK